VANEEHMRLAGELRELKIESKKLDADKQRLSGEMTRLTSERQELEDKLHKVEVERDKLLGEKATADQARKRVEDSLAKAETAKQRAEEEKATAAAARDKALASTDEQRREIDRLKKEIESQAALGGSTANMPAVKPEDFDGAPTSEGEVSAEARIHELEEELAKLATELAMAQEAAGSAKTQPSNGAPETSDIKQRAEEAYNGINDLLSELRTSILMARDLVAAGDTSAALTDAIQASVDKTEDAKGVLRTLKEVIE
jgi:chromosome segregation ATPase